MIVNKTDYSDSNKNFLYDTGKFEKINLKIVGILSFAGNREKRVDNISKKLVVSNNMSEEIRRSLKAVRTRPGVMYWTWKVHKDVVDNCPSFWPILSTINTPIFKLTKFLVPILKPLTSNECTTKESFALAVEMAE